MSNRFSYVEYDEQAARVQTSFKDVFMTLEKMVGDGFSPSRESSLILTKLEEAYMWVGKALRDEQIKRSGDRQP